MLRMLTLSAFAAVTIGAGASATEAPDEPDAALSRLPVPTPVENVAGEREPNQKGRRAYLGLVTREAQARGLPPDVADAVATVESAYEPAAVGGVGEVGLMQVRPSTAAMLGHKGTVAELGVPETNIRFGVAYLARAWQLAGGDLCRALMKYRAGHGEERMTPLSVEYCRRARVHLAAIGSPLGDAPLPAVAGPAAQSPGRPHARAVYRSAKVQAPGTPDAASERNLRLAKRLWAEHVERVRRIDARISRIMGAPGSS